MMIELTTDNVIVIVSSLVGGGFVLWARSVTAHNKLSELRSAVLQKDIADVQKSNNELRTCLQETREEYVTTARFDALFNEIKADIKQILNQLADKHDRADCRDCKFSRGVRVSKDD